MGRRNKHKRNKSGLRGRITNKTDERITILIVCEGDTEEHYFKKKGQNLKRSVTLTIRNMKGGDPKQIFEEADKEDKSNNYDQTWCVFDNDLPKKFTSAIKKIEKRDREIAKAIAEEKAKSKHKRKYRDGKRFRAAYSNPCFELWFLLHFKNIQTCLSCSNCEEKMTQNLRNLQKKFRRKLPGLKEKKYDKGTIDMYTLLNVRPDMVSEKQAIEYAKNKLKNSQYRTPPCTTVYQLVEELNNFS